MKSSNNINTKFKRTGFASSKTIAISLIAAVGLFTGCEPNSFTLRMPPKFAEIDCEGTNFVAKGIDTNGTTIAGKVENQNARLKNTSPEFWEICVKRALEKKGYQFVSSKDIVSISKLKGRLLRFKYQSQKGDYIYLIAMFKQPGQKPVFLTEAGGLRKNISKTLESEIIDCFRTISIEHDSRKGN